jgi:hypothetical protein
MLTDHIRFYIDGCELGLCCSSISVLVRSFADDGFADDGCPDFFLKSPFIPDGLPDGLPGGLPETHVPVVYISVDLISFDKEVLKSDRFTLGVSGVSELPWRFPDTVLVSFRWSSERNIVSCQFMSGDIYAKARISLPPDLRRLPDNVAADWHEEEGNSRYAESLRAGRSAFWIHQE